MESIIHFNDPEFEKYIRQYRRYDIAFYAKQPQYEYQQQRNQRKNEIRHDTCQRYDDIVSFRV